MVKKSSNSMTIFGKTIPGYVFVLGIVLIAVLGFAGYNLVANEMDRRKFVEIEETVDTLVSRINKEFGTEVIGNNSRCYESGEKYKKGSTICVYEKSFLLGDDAETLVAFLVKQSDVVSGSKDIFNLLDFWTTSENFSCSLGQEDELFLLECSDYARANYYPFSD